MSLEILTKRSNDKITKLAVRSDPEAQDIGFALKGKSAVCRIPKLDASASDGEEKFRVQLRSAVEYARVHGIECVEVLLSTIASRSILPYAFSVAYETAEEILADCDVNVDVVIVYPMKANRGEFLPNAGAGNNERVVVQHSFSVMYGEPGDPLVGEFNRFTREMKKERTLRELIRIKMQEKHIPSRSVVYTRAGVSKETFSKIMNEEGNEALEDYKPGKRTVAALAIGLRLDIEEAEEFFHSAGYHLGTEELPDQIFRFFVGVKRNYDIFQINACLKYYGYKMLGTQVRGDSADDAPQQS